MSDEGKYFPANLLEVVEQQASAADRWLQCTHTLDKKLDDIFLDSRKKTVLGRGGNVTHVESELQPGLMSKEHLTIWYDWDTCEWKVRDENSINGTFINKKRIKEEVIKDGDELRFGPSTSLYTYRLVEGFGSLDKKESKEPKTPLATHLEEQDDIISVLKNTVANMRRALERQLSKILALQTENDTLKVENKNLQEENKNLQEENDTFRRRKRWCDPKGGGAGRSVTFDV